MIYEVWVCAECGCEMEYVFPNETPYEEGDTRDWYCPDCDDDVDAELVDVDRDGIHADPDGDDYYSDGDGGRGDDA